MILVLNAGHKEMEATAFGFNQFRIKVAEYLDRDFGAAYEHYLTSGDTDDFFEKAAYCDKLTFELVDFFLAKAENGEISPSVAEQLLPILHNIDINSFTFNIQKFYDLVEFSILWKLPICWKFKKLKFY